MEFQPYFSVIIPVRDVGHLITRTLASLLAQVETDYELIVVDDGSTDDTVQKVKQMLPHFANAHLVESGPQDSVSPGRPRNVGLARAKGLYVCFFDSDDAYHPMCLKELRCALKSMNQPDVIAFCAERLEVKDDLGEVAIRSHFFIESGLEEVVVTGPQAALYFLNHSISYSTACKLYSRALLNKHKITFDEGANYEDQWFNIQALCLADQVGVYPRDLYFYIKRPDSNFNRRSIASVELLKELVIKVTGYARERLVGCVSDAELDAAIFNFGWLLYTNVYILWICKFGPVETQPSGHENLQRAFLLGAVELAGLPGFSQLPEGTKTVTLTRLTQLFSELAVLPFVDDAQRNTLIRFVQMVYHALQQRTSDKQQKLGE